MFSGIGDKNLTFLEVGRRMPDLQCQKDLPDHNRLPSITIVALRGLENF